MPKLNQFPIEHIGCPAEHQAGPRVQSQTVDQYDSERQKRITALMLMFGLWKGRTDIPADGLVFQEQLRSEE